MRKSALKRESARQRRNRRRKRREHRIANKVRHIIEHGIDSLVRGPNVATVPWRVETRAVVLNEEWMAGIDVD